MTFDECCVACATLTGMSRAEWEDFLSLESDAQAAAAEAYRRQDWTRSADTIAAVIAVLTTAAQVAGAATGIVGAVNALRNL